MNNILSAQVNAKTFHVILYHMSFNSQCVLYNLKLPLNFHEKITILNNLMAFLHTKQSNQKKQKYKAVLIKYTAQLYITIIQIFKVN